MFYSTFKTPAAIAVYNKLKTVPREWIDANRPMIAKCLWHVRRTSGRVEALALRNALTTTWLYWPAR